MNWTYTTTELAEMLGVPAPSREIEFSGVSTDSRTVERGALFVALPGPNFDGNDYLEKAFELGAAAALGTRSSTGPVIVVADPLIALQRFAAIHRSRCSARIVAITGSAGKTTSKDFAAAVLGTKYRTLKTVGNLNNEIGCPVSLLRMDTDTEFAAIEMGANHAGEIARLCALARPDESAIVNIAPAHLEGFGSIEGVAKAKAEIADALPPGGTFYVNADDPRCDEIGRRFAGRTVRYGSDGSGTLDVCLRSCTMEGNGEMLLDIAPIGVIRLPLVAPAHASNVLLAVAVGLEHGVTEFEEPLRASIGSSARVKVRRIGPIEVIDDTYNANPASMRAAIDALKVRRGGAKYCALGAMLELGDSAAALHRAAGEYAAMAGVTGIFVRGPYACDTIAGARSGGVARAEAIEDHAAIAAAIAEAAVPGDVVLVKGSRGMKMELVVAALTAIYAARAAVEA